MLEWFPLKHRFDTKAEKCDSAIEHKGASQTHRENAKLHDWFDFDDAESSNSELGSDCKMYFYDLGTSHRQGRGRSPAKHNGSRWLLASATIWKRILESD